MSILGTDSFTDTILGFILELLIELDRQLDLEVWTIMTPMDCACIDLDGSVFSGGEGPQPVTDTHPNCQCVRIPISIFDTPDGIALRRYLETKT